MKQCPACKGSFKQLKKGGCPICGEPLFYYKGQAKRESDKKLADTMRHLAKPVIEKNLGVGGYLMLNAEWVFAYRTIDTLRAWLNSQPTKHVTTEELVLLVLNHFLTDDTYWKKNIRSLAGVAKQCVSVAMVLYRNIKIKKAAEEVQQQRIDNANINQLRVDYTV